MLMCVCLRILASSRIPRYDLGDKPLISEVVLLHPYPLAKCNYYRSIGDTRNGIANLRELLDEGAQGDRSRYPAEHKRSRSWP
jgi:hypothetical protein